MSRCCVLSLETIAQTAQYDRFAAAVATSGLNADQAATAVSGESFGSLVAQLRRTEADGYEPEQAITRVVRAGGLDGADDSAAVRATRLNRLTTARSSGTRPRRRPRYVAGLIPEATGPMPADMRQSLTELADLIEQRATALAEQAIVDNQPWVRRLGPPPADPARRGAWEQQVRTIAAYRGRYRITSDDPLGPAPASQGQQFDHQQAALAVRRAQTEDSQDAPHRHGSEQQIDTGHGLRR